MANSKIQEPSTFASRHKGSNRGVAIPKFSGAGKAPVGNAANSERPANPGGLNLIRKISAQGTFKSSKS